MKRACILFVAACSSAPAAPDTSGPTTFAALASDFQSYPSWTNFYVGDVPDPNGVDLAGARTVYINRVPPPGTTSFPVGTIIVKVIRTSDAPATWQMFGLVKRGAGFDEQGAPGWEWFGLATSASNEVVIEWRGDGPPPDGGYGGIANVGCVYCHTASKANDYVQTPALQLADLH